MSKHSSIDKIFSKFCKAGKVVIASTLAKTPPSFFSTGSASLDWAIGGGIPNGKMTVFWGSQGAGKSWISLKTTAKALKENPDKYAIWVDTEFSFDPHRASSLGVDLDRLVVIQGNTPDMVIPPISMTEEDVLQDKNLCLIVVDSIMGMSSINEVNQMSDGNVGSAANSYGGIAKTINVLLPILARWSHLLSISTILINHVRSNMDVMTAKYDPYVMGGGEKLKHLMRVCCFLSKVKSSKEGVGVVDESIESMNGARVMEGYLIRAKVNKTCYAVEGRVAEFTVNFVIGEVQKKEEELVNLATALKIIQVDGQTHTYKDLKKGRKSGFIDHLIENPSVYDQIMEDVKATNNRKLFKASSESVTDDRITDDQEELKSAAALEEMINEAKETTAKYRKKSSS